MVDIEFKLSKKEKGQVVHFLCLMKIKVLTNNLIQWPIFENNLQTKEFFLFVIMAF